jgi:hypothetical protein
LDKFTTDNASVLNVGFQKYDKATKNYVPYDKATGVWQKNSTTVNDVILHPGDAFFVYPKVVGSGKTVEFNLSQITSSKGTGVDNSNKLEIDSIIYTSLIVEMRSQADTTVKDIAKLVSRTGNFDLSMNQFDLLNIGGTCIVASFYSETNSFKSSVKALSNEKSFLVPLSVQGCGAGKYSLSFSIDYNNAGKITEFDLFDKYLNKTYTLYSGLKYTFDMNADSLSYGLGRFYLNVKNNTLQTPNIKNKSVAIYPNPVLVNGNVLISSENNSMIKYLSINDMNGRLIYEDNSLNCMIKEVLLKDLGLKPGIYSVRATLGSEIVLTKLIINE